MQTPKWFVVARNEYRIRLSRIRKIRRYFPFLVVGLLALYIVFIAPAFVSLFIDDLMVLLFSEGAVPMVQIILFTVFIYFMIIPITDTLRQEQTAPVEIFLAAPVKPSDVLLGEFLGELPFYAIFITVVTGLLTAILDPVGLDIVQKTIIIIIFVVTFLSALWIGTVIASVLRTRLGKSARGKDIGRALAMIIALPLVALFYAMMYGGFLDALTNPETGGIVKAVLGLLPSSWGAEIVVGFLNNPSNIGAVGLQTLTRFGGLLAFFAAVLWVGSRAANRAYSLEPETFVAARAKPDGLFYRTIRGLGGGRSFGVLLASLFKDYGRRLENLSNITYIIGLLVLMNIFIVPNVSTEPDEPPIALIMAQFMFPILAVMVAGGVTVEGKEKIFIFRKAPGGVGRIVKSTLVRSWLVVIPIAAAITIVATILDPRVTVPSLLINCGLMMLIVAADVMLALGLFLLNPPFSIKSVKMWVNVMIVMFVSMGLFAISMLVLAVLDAWPEPVSGILHAMLLLTPLSWLVGSLFLYIGKRKLSRIE